MDAVCSFKWLAIFYENTKYPKDKFNKENLYSMLFGCSLNEHYITWVKISCACFLT
jgi:hypothetical protein